MQQQTQVHLAPSDGQHGPVQAPKSWSFVDKSKWPARGEWDDEPDKLQWIDAATGLDCLIHRGPHGALCGYVGVPPGHRFHGTGYDNVRLTGVGESWEDSPSVHGGLTFADSCAEEVRKDGSGICHIPEPGRPADVWWLGFDCAHCDDLSPGYDSRGHGRYRDLAYVKRECTSLAKQLQQVPA